MSVDVVICVHNGLSDVRCCLDSVYDSMCSRKSARIIVVNDGSDAPTCLYLRDWCRNHSNICALVENDQAIGYTKAANQGIKATQSDYVVLLNSDTIVPANWIEGLLRCAESDPSIGLAGPVSNAASWQSVPERFGPIGDWAVNELPTGYDVDRFATLIAECSDSDYPRVPILNGFCLLIKRRLIDSIGLLDEEHFPQGYGEENDYCLRAGDAGFSLVVADDVYVHHAKSASFGHERRRQLSKQGGKMLTKLHGKARIDRAVKALRSCSELEMLRGRVSARTRWLTRERPSRLIPRIVFLLPAMGGGGGVHSVVQEVWGMRALGVDASVAVPRRWYSSFRRHYPFATRIDGFFIPYAKEAKLPPLCSNAQIVVATANASVSTARDISIQTGAMLGYYVQDYEPWFFPEGSALWKTAMESYRLAKDGILFAKTDWVCQTVSSKHDVEVSRVRPSIDLTVYRPPDQLGPEHDEASVKLCAMVRPSTPRRSPQMTLRLLKETKQVFGERVEVHTFGDRLGKVRRWLRQGRDFEHVKHGHLTRERVANLLQQSDVFIDLSTWQAFGRTGLEAMACGTATVLPEEGGTRQYARDGINALLVDTQDYAACKAAVFRYVEDPDFRRSVKAEALKTASDYSIAKASLSEVTLLLTEWNRRFPDRPFSLDYFPQLRGD